MSRIILITLLALGFLSACVDQPLPAGVVAMVNGEPIYLHSIETLLDSRSSGQSPPSPTDLEDMQKSYANALGVLLTHALVRQELRQREIKLPDGTQEEAIKDLTDALGESGLEDFLTQSSIRKDDWEQLMYDYLALETFRNQVLAPQIKIELEEIRNYYEKHKSDFQLPPYIRACFLSAPEKTELEKLCAEETLRDISDSPLVLCADMEAALLPSPWLEEQANIKPNSCGKFRKENESWQTVAILSKSPAQSPALPELYALIEKIILEQKQQAAFDKWLAEKVAASSILVAPELNQSLRLGQEETSATLEKGE